MRPFASTLRLFCLGMLVTFAARVSHAAESAVPDSGCPNILIGFVGGFGGQDDLRHVPVQLAARIREQSESDDGVVFARVFENQHEKQAYKAVLRCLDTDHDGAVSAKEKARARIVLYGHSWGGAAVVALARALQRKGIPILLTVQVDSVRKLWHRDAVIPSNVAEAINFYQRHGIIRGQPHIAAEDPEKTQILGNFRMDYREHPVHCAVEPWADRVFTPDHAQSECDPQLWGQIEAMVRQRLLVNDAAATPAIGPVAAGSQP